MRDVTTEATAGVVRRPGRAGLTAFGCVLGIGSFVATVGVTTTAASQIGARFDALKATEVSVESADPAEGATDSPFPPDFESRLGRLNGVVATGHRWELEGEALSVATRPGPQGAESQRLPILAVSPGYLTVARPTLASGVLFSQFHQRRAERVVVLGAAAATTLGIHEAHPDLALWIGNRPFTVVGILSDTKRAPDLVLSVMLPDSTADAWFGHRVQDERLLVETRAGASQLIASQAPFALDPAHPDRYVVLAAPDPRRLREEVETDVGSLYLILALVSLTITTVSIANITLVSVMERVPEIGLRRALGATRRQIATVFLAESGAIGLFGGLIGAAAGVCITVGVSVVRHWTPVVDLRLVVLAPALGAFCGVVAGAYPASRASRVDPVLALRH